MSRIRKFIRRSPEERLLFAAALPVVAGLRVALWLLPFRILRPLLGRLTRGVPTAAGGEATRQVAWAVSSAARCVPRATCLTQALAAQLLLARRGVASEVCYGVARAGGPTRLAHAWLESHGEIVVGGEALERYVPLTPLARRRRARG